MFFLNIKKMYFYNYVPHEEQQEGLTLPVPSSMRDLTFGQCTRQCGILPVLYCGPEKEGDWLEMAQHIHEDDISISCA